MSKFDKVILKLLDRNSTITYDELKYILGKLGFEEKKTGKSSGSRLAFVKIDTHEIIRLNKPHPANELKMYMKKNIVEQLKIYRLI